MSPALSLFGATLHPYALLLGLGAVACIAVFAVLTFRRHRAWYAENIFALEMLLISMAAALPAAVFFDALFKVWERGALVFRGATFYGGALPAIGVWCLLLRIRKRREVPLAERLSDLAPGIALGHCIGRVGCFLGGCCYGSPTESPFGVVFAEGSEAYARFGAVALHPTQLYEAAVLLVLFAILLIWGGKNAFPLYCMLYGAARFAIEFLRADERGSLFGLALSPAQAVSLALILLGEGLLLASLLRERARLLPPKK